MFEVEPARWSSDVTFPSLDSFCVLYDALNTEMLLFICEHQLMRVCPQQWFALNVKAHQRTPLWISRSLPNRVITLVLILAVSAATFWSLRFLEKCWSSAAVTSGELSQHHSHSRDFSAMFNQTLFSIWWNDLAFGSCMTCRVWKCTWDEIWKSISATLEKINHAFVQ